MNRDRVKDSGSTPRFTQPAPLGEIFPPEPIKSRWERITIIGLLVICATMLAIVVAALKAPPVLSYDNLPFPVVGDVKVFYPGQTVPLVVGRCNSLNHEILYTVTRTIKNVETHVSYILPSTRVTIESGCHSGVSQLHLLPTDLPPGRYILGGVGTVQGPINDIDVPFYSVEIEVRKP